MYIQQALSDVEQTTSTTYLHVKSLKFTALCSILQPFRNTLSLYDAQGYAYRCRQRRVSGQRELREQVQRLERELTVVRTEHDALEAECVLLRASCASACGPISLKEQ